MGNKATTIYLPPDLVILLDRVKEEEGYDSRSSAARILLRKILREREMLAEEEHTHEHDKRN